MIADPGVARLEVRLFGSGEVMLDGGRLSAFGSLRLLRFLAMIALRRTAQHRSRLAFEIWPDSSESQARTNLRKLVHEFRHSIPDIEEFVRIDSKTVEWISTGSSTVDVLQFRDAISAGNLDLAARLYAGDLLSACYDDWILKERATLRSEAYNVYAELTGAAMERSDHEATLRHAQQVLAVEPTDEVAVRHQICAHIAQGDRPAALRAYHRYAETLQREIGATPGESMAEIYRSLRVGPSNSSDLPEEPPTAVESLFTGRDDEWNQLIQLWRQTTVGDSRLLLVTGEAGIGKSRLVAEFAQRVRGEGHVVATARAYEAAGRLPWGPVVDLLRSESMRSGIETLPQFWKSSLSRLLPELEVPAGTVWPSAYGDPAQRRRLFDSVSRVLIGEGRPRLIIIDDLQWCDAETIELIGFLLRSGEGIPFLIVGTVRFEEVPLGHPLHALIDALGQSHSVTSVTLERLDAATTAKLASRLLGRDEIEQERQTLLWRETEGNPLFVIEAIRAGIGANDGRSILTPTMRAVLRARLGQLSDGARGLTEVAAVIGRPFSIKLMCDSAGIREQDLVDDIDELWRRRIVREHGFTYDFSHDKLRAVALEMISPARLRQIHRAVAKALSVERGGAINAASAQIAAHYDQAGDVALAIRSYRTAGAQALVVSAVEEAIAMFKRALTLLPDVSPSPDRDALELDLLMALGPPLLALQGWGSEDVMQAYERASFLCRRLSRPVEPPILRGLALAAVATCHLDRALERGRDLVNHPSGQRTARTEGLYLLGVSALWRGDLAGARHHLEDALEAFNESDLDEHLALYAQDPQAVCLVRLAQVELWAGDPGRSDEIADLALTYAENLDHLLTSGYVNTFASVIAAESEDLARLSGLLSDAERMWDHHHIRHATFLTGVSGLLNGWKAFNAGAPDAIERILEPIARWRADGQTLFLSYGLLLLAKARLLTGEFDAGRAAAAEGLAWTFDHDQRYIEAELWRIDGELAYHLGYAEVARSSLREAVDVATSQGAGWLELRAAQSVAARFPDQAAFERLAELVERIPSGHQLPLVLAAQSLLALNY